MNTKNSYFQGGSYSIQKGFVGTIYQKKGAFIKKWYFFDKNKGGGSWQTQKFYQFPFFGASPNSSKLISNKSKLRVFFKMG